MVNEMSLQDEFAWAIRMRRDWTQPYDISYPIDEHEARVFTHSRRREHFRLFREIRKWAA